MEQNFIIIGEAANHVPDDVQARHLDVPWRLMKAMRNRLVHVYFDADPQIVWETVTNDLPSLLSPLQRLLMAEEQGDPDSQMTE